MNALTRFNHNTYYPSIFDSFFGRDSFAPVTQGTMPSVNVVESKEGFRIEVAAPGFKKEDFKVTLNHNQLTIGAQVETEENKKEEKFTRREFKYATFQRSFTLPNTVKGDQIDANYTSGVLVLQLPKKQEVKEKMVREIAIA